MDNFSGRLAVITGAGSGIGRALAIACARRGMRALLADINEEGLATTAGLLGRQDTLTLRVDVSRAEDVAAMADLAFAQDTDVALLFNNAGVASGGWVWETTPKDWQWLIGVNLMGVVHGIQSFSPRLMQQHLPSHIINTASAAGLLSVPAGAAYCATKHGVVTLSECLLHELKAKQAGVGVSVLCPSFVPTAIAESERSRPAGLQHPGMPRVLRDETMERAMLHAPLSADQVAEITMQGVENNAFYILPHEDVRKGVAKRVAAIVEGREPAAGRLPGIERSAEKTSF